MRCNTLRRCVHAIRGKVAAETKVEKSDHHQSATNTASSQSQVAATSTSTSTEVHMKKKQQDMMDEESVYLQHQFERWLVSRHPIALDNVSMQFFASGRDWRLRRGLVAKKDMKKKTVVISLPMSIYTLSKSSLTLSLNQHSERASSSSSSSAAPINFMPPFDEEFVLQFLYSRGIADPCIYPQVYFAMLLAAERMQLSKSPFSSYLDMLPHPAMDDRAVMMLHKHMLDPTQLLEWDAHQHEFTSIVRLLHGEWEHLLRHQRSLVTSHAPSLHDVSGIVPPVEVMYWALRTIFARHFQLPKDGVTPKDAGSKLDVYTFGSVKELEMEQTFPFLQEGLSRLTNRIKRTFLSRGAAATESSSLRADEKQAAFHKFELEPMLVPLLDCVGHISPPNVGLEVTVRSGLGPCVELVAMDNIKEGEEVGASYNSCHSVAFTLYRFGLLPL